MKIMLKDFSSAAWRVCVEWSTFFVLVAFVVFTFIKVSCSALTLWLSFVFMYVLTSLFTCDKVSR